MYIPTGIPAWVKSWLIRHNAHGSSYKTGSEVFFKTLWCKKESYPAIELLAQYIEQSSHEGDLSLMQQTQVDITCRDSSAAKCSEQMRVSLVFRYDHYKKMFHVTIGVAQ